MNNFTGTNANDILVGGNNGGYFVGNLGNDAITGGTGLDTVLTDYGLTNYVVIVDLN